MFTSNWQIQWQMRLFGKFNCLQKALFLQILSLNCPWCIHTSPSIQIQVHRAARRRFLGERAAATYEALSRAQRNIEIEFVSLLFSDR